MRFIQHYSGSEANLYQVIALNGDSLIIEAGVSWQKLLSALNFNLKGVLGALISHEHL
jgi:hypothetical protein